MFFNQIFDYYKNASISKKLKLFGITTALFGIVLFTMITFIYQYIQAKSLMEERVDTFSQFLAENLAPAILFDDMKVVSTVLASLKYEKNIMQVYILDSKHKILQRYDENNSTLEDKILHNLIEKSFLWKEGKLYNHVSIFAEKEKIASLIMVSSLNVYHHRLMKEVTIAILALLLASWISLRLTEFLRDEILVPIQELSENTYKILKTRDLSNHVLIKNDDEIGQLGKHFNRMLSDLKYMKKELEEEKNSAEYKALHDDLTKLPNRMGLMHHLIDLIEQSSANNTQFAVLFMDLDHFKTVNDSMGHDVGDEVLKIFSQRIKSSIRQNDMLSRMGGDEFILVLENINSEESIVFISNKILRTMDAPMNVEGELIYLSVSIGISFYPKDGITPEKLIKNADAAMYDTKSNGRNGYHFFTEDLTEAAYARLTLEVELREAVKNKEFVIYYQPQVDAGNGKLIGMEALVRWDHPTKGVIEPDEFLALANELGLLIRIDRVVIEEGIKQLKEWSDKGLNPGHLAFNLTMKHLIDKDFLSTIKSLLAIYGCDEQNIEFEISESAVMEYPEYAIGILKELNNFGISLSVDDFGTGYSSLSYLKRLPINTLKIDRSFIQGLPEDKDDAAITKAIIALANSLGLNIISEGVETIGQSDFLVEQGCPIVQGYLYGKPMKKNDMEQFMIANR